MPRWPRRTLMYRVCRLLLLVDQKNPPCTGYRADCCYQRTLTYHWQTTMLYINLWRLNHTLTCFGSESHCSFLVIFALVFFRGLHPLHYSILPPCKEGYFYDESRWPSRHYWKNRPLMVLFFSSWYFWPIILQRSPMHHHFPSSHLTTNASSNKQDGQKGIIVCFFV